MHTLGDKVGFRLTPDGTVSFFVNGKSQGVVARNIHKEGFNIFPVVDVCYKSYAVRITRAGDVSKSARITHYIIHWRFTFVQKHVEKC